MFYKKSVLKNFANFTAKHLRPATLFSSRPEMFLKRVLKICSKFTGEHPCQATLLQSHFGMGVLLQTCCIFLEQLFLRTPLDGCVLKKRLALVFSYEFCEIFKNTFFTDHLWTTTSNCLLLKTTRVASFISKA